MIFLFLNLAYFTYYSDLPLHSLCCKMSCASQYPSARARVCVHTYALSTVNVYASMHVIPVGVGVSTHVYYNSVH